MLENRFTKLEFIRKNNKMVSWRLDKYLGFCMAGLPLKERGFWLSARVELWLNVVVRQDSSEKPSCFICRVFSHFPNDKDENADKTWIFPHSSLYFFPNLRLVFCPKAYLKVAMSVFPSKIKACSVPMEEETVAGHLAPGTAQPPEKKQTYRKDF